MTNPIEAHKAEIKRLRSEAAEADRAKYDAEAALKITFAGVDFEAADSTQAQYRRSIAHLSGLVSRAELHAFADWIDRWYPRAKEPT